MVLAKEDTVSQCPPCKECDREFTSPNVHHFKVNDVLWMVHAATEEDETGGYLCSRCFTRRLGRSLTQDDLLPVVENIPLLITGQYEVPEVLLLASETYEHDVLTALGNVEITLWDIRLYKNSLYQDSDKGFIPVVKLSFKEKQARADVLIEIIKKATTPSPSRRWKTPRTDRLDSKTRPCLK